MTKRLLPIVLALALVGSSGCLFHRKSAKAKENPDIATGTEVEFQQRWVAHRESELTSQGVDAVTAQQQAQREFREKYPFATPTKK